MSYAIAFAEDNALNRSTFIHKIQFNGKLDLVFAAVNGNDCMQQMKGLPSAKLPQVIFMDLEMPELDGISTIGLLHALHPEIHFIVLTVFDDEEKIFEAIKAGASGYLLKHESAETIYEAVTQVMEYGGAPMSPAIARKALQLMSRSVIPEMESGVAMPDKITSREKEILEQMVTGRDAKRIASDLDISVTTVRKHIANIYEKLHVQSKSEVLRMAHQNKWFQR